MNVLLQALERDGLVTRAEQATTGRVLPTELTDAGRRQLATASAAVRGVEDRMKSGMDETEQAVFADLLARSITSLRDARP